MRGSTLKVTIGDVIYHIDDPKPGDGLKATVSAIQEEQTEKGSVSRILHRHRFNLDKDGERQKFAEKAGTYASDLDEVRDRVLDFLAPAPPLGEEPSGETDPAVREEALALLAAPDLLDQLGNAIQVLGYAGAFQPDDALVDVRTGVQAKRSNVEGVRLAGRTVYYDVLGHQSYGPLGRGRVSEDGIHVLARDGSGPFQVVIYTLR